MKKLLEIIRKSSTAKRWSKAVELTRCSEIHIETKNNTEISLRLSEKRSLCSPVISFWPDDEDWCCDCNSREDPCIHVITAIILLNNLKILKKKTRTKKTSTGTIAYRFSRKQGLLVFDRVIVAAKKSIPITSSLVSMMNGRMTMPHLVPSKHDLTIDNLMKDNPLASRSSSPAKIAQLFYNLNECKDVRLDGKTVKVSHKFTGFVTRIEDESGGFRIFGQQDPSISEVFRNGVALCGKTLRPIHNVKLPPYELKLLAESKYFGAKEVVYIASELIPSLRKKLTVEIKTKKIQDPIMVNPRVDFVIKKRSQRLIFNSQIVYGDPPIATVKNEHLCLKGKKIPVRNLEEEQRIRNKFANFFGFNLEEEKKFVGESTVAIADRIKKWEGYKKIDVLDHFTCYAELTPQVNITSNKELPVLVVDFLTTTATSSGKQHTADPMQVLEAWKSGAKMVPLREGGWANIPHDWLKIYGERILHLLMSRDDKSILPKCMISDVVDLYSEASCDGDIPSSIYELNKFLQDSTKLPPYRDVPGLKAKLRPYQKQGVRWLTFLRDQSLGALLADDMGLGKTLQSICILHGKSLIVAPTSVLYNWEAEIKRFRSQLRVNIYHGPNRKLDMHADVIMTTYAVMRLDQEELAQQKWDVVILDEAQTIKNPDSKIAKAVYQISSPFKLALTGTPIENRLDDLWSIFHFLNRGFMHQRKDFQRDYIKPISLGDKEVSERLRKRVKPFVMRRLKSEVAKDLPPRTNIVLYNELDEQERITYSAIELASRQDILEKMKVNSNVMQMLESILRLRQAACHTAMLPGYDKSGSSKVDLLIDHLETCIAGGHKALIFSQWTRFLDLIQTQLEEKKYRFLRIDGSTKDRHQIVDTFQTDNDYPFLLLSLKAAGIGLNLTAADHVFIMDPWWNPAVEDQAADRTYRIGQDKPVMVYKIVTKNSIEEKIIDLQNKKKDLVGSVMDGGKHYYQLTRKEILGLLD